MDDQDGTSPQRLLAALCGDAGEAAFRAQLLGAGGLRRGLRGGLQVLQAARATYLQTEWSGGTDRRLPAGLLTRRKV